MGVMKNGQWRNELDAGDLAGMDELNRAVASEAGRYHLYVSHACPYAHRPALVHSLLGLDEAVSLSSVAAKRFDSGWAFDDHWPDPLFDAAHLSELFRRSKADYNGRVTVPVLWDKPAGRIVNTESADLARILARDFLPLARTPMALYPDDKAAAIDADCAWLQQQLISKIYQAGFSRDQSVYDAACDEVFAALATLEQRLSTQRYLGGTELNLADLFLFPVLIRFDTVYHGLFKLNCRRIQDYPQLFGYLRDLLSVPAIRGTVDLDYIRQHYYFSLRHINPGGIVPAGPEIDWSQPHHRRQLSE